MEITKITITKFQLGNWGAINYQIELETDIGMFLYMDAHFNNWESAHIKATEIVESVKVHQSQTLFIFGSK